MLAVLVCVLVNCSAIVSELRAIVGIVFETEKFYGRNSVRGTI